VNISRHWTIMALMAFSGLLFRQKRRIKFGNIWFGNRVMDLKLSVIFDIIIVLW
jgi:hypothetical protein